MSDIKTLHRQAMDSAELATNAELQGETEKAHSLFREAFNYEREAASLVASDLSLEPTRSVLYRSAASLAMDCNEWREAERLIAIALSGNPPDSIAEELRDLLEQVYFNRHLELRGWELEEEDVQLSLAGDAVGFGVAFSEDFIGRVQSFEKLVYRTAERKSGLRYREGGNPKKAIQEEYGIYVSVPRAASFAVSLRVGQAKQLTLPNIDSVSVIDELLSCLELFNNANDEELRKRISETPYYRNFMALARQLSPDGKNVNFVGFTSHKIGQQRKVSLTRTRGQKPVLEEATTVDRVSQHVSVTGTLRYADDTSREKGRIRLLEEQGGSHHTIIVPEGMMDDIVKPLWGDRVQVTGYTTNEGIHLEDILKLDATEQ